MTTITNKHSLPEALVLAVQNDDYDRGDAKWSVTDLINPPRLVILKRRHDDEIEEDVVDRIWALQGQVAHKIMERAGQDDAFVEERLFMEIDGVKISGATDLYPATMAVMDYKFTSVWTRIYGDRLKEWEKQLNLLALLWREHSYRVEHLYVILVYRDWRKGEALQKGKEYPPPAEKVELPLWDQPRQLFFARTQVRNLEIADKLFDDNLPPCTPEEMWERPTTYAVMKEGRKSALRVLDSEPDAVEWMAKNVSFDDHHKLLTHSIVTRPGVRVRCESYCPAAPFCNQFKAYKAAQPNQGE